VTKSVKRKHKTEAESATVVADEQALIHQLKENPAILCDYPELLAILEIPHDSGPAVSLVERQVKVLREKNARLDQHLSELMAVARDNERLAQSRQRIAINLLGAHDLDDVVCIVLDELSNELKADYAVIRLFTENRSLVKQYPGLFVARDDAGIHAFKTMLEHKNPVCGRSIDEQKAFLFTDNAAKIASAAIIPLTAGADLGLIGLGSNNNRRFQATMGTHFLAQIGDLVSAALAVHLEANDCASQHP